MVFAGAVFLLAFSGIVGLFVLKQWERRHGEVLLRSVREKADEQALRIKAFILAGVRDLEKVPPRALLLLRGSVRVGAIAFGHLAHWIGERSHDLADLVSHKHRFERRAPRSEFLKQVIEHPTISRNGSGNGISHEAPSAAPAIESDILVVGKEILRGEEEVLDVPPRTTKKRKTKTPNVAGKKNIRHPEVSGLDI